MLKHFLIFFLLLNFGVSKAASIIIPMDESQKNHLKAYGIAFWTLKKRYGSRLALELQRGELYDEIRSGAGKRM